MLSHRLKFNFSEWNTQVNKNTQKTSAPCSFKSNSQKNHVSTEILIKAQFFNSGWLKCTMNYSSLYDDKKTFPLR